MTTITNEVQLHTVMMEAFMPAYGKKAVELAYKDEQPELHQEYAACIACAWPLVYRMTQAGVTSSVLDTGEVAEYMLSFVGRNYQFEGNEFITIDNILDVASRLKVWSVTDGVVELNMDMIEVSRKKQSMSAREAGTVERVARDVAKIGDNWIKKSMSSAKDKVDDKTISQVAKDAQTYLEAQQFNINGDALKVIAALKDKSLRNVVAQCYNDFNKTLIQQCDFDARGRIYYMAHNAPHPAADDARVALYKMVTDTQVQIGSAAHDAYLAELADIDNEDHKYKAMVMKNDIASAVDGWYTPSQPVGLDAKSSGAQIYSILLGDAKLGASCGLTTEYTQDQKINDPYSITARILSSKLGGI